MRSWADGALTQRRLAYRSGVSQSTIARIESGSIEASIATLNRILLGAGEAVELAARPLPTTSDPDHVAAALRRSPEERVERMAAFANFAQDLRDAPRGST